MTTVPDIIDFHCHFRPPWWRPQAGTSRRPEDLKDLDALAVRSRSAGLTLRLLSAPVEGIFGAEGPVHGAEISRLNDYLASAVSSRSDVLAGLATIDAFSADAAAAEAQRATRTLKLPGLVVDSARSDRFFGQKETLPLLEAADELGIPIFVHPVAAPHREHYVAAAGTVGNSLTRGLMNGIAFLTVLESRVLERWPRARLVFTGLGTTALLIAAAELGDATLRQRLDATQGQIHFDIMGLSPANIRYLTEVIGPERLVVGSDDPFMQPLITANSVRDSLRAAGLDENQQALVASGNALRVLNRQESS